MSTTIKQNPETGKPEAAMIVSKSWTNVHYNLFFVVFYTALGAASAIHPVNQQTLEIAGENAAWIGRVLASLFFVMAYLSWRYELKDKWLTISTMPAVIWGAYMMSSILGSDRASWVTAVYVAASIALLVYVVELIMRTVSSETGYEKAIKEIIDMKHDMATLKAENEKLKDASGTNERRPA